MNRRSPSRGVLAGLAAALALGAGPDDRPDRLVADFEAPTYAPWVVEGTAFGERPARGALPGQMAVSGFEGHGLVNSFSGGDDSTGTLTSPPFAIERKYLNFLIGGGKYPGETCLDLLVDGVVVRSATGPNDRPGGSERLDWSGWDVSDLVGKPAVLRAVDRRKGGWGHVNVDQIVQSDRPRGTIAAARDVDAPGRYLLLPVDESAPVRRVKVEGPSRVAREFDIKLADGPGAYSTFLDLAPLGGGPARVSASLPAGSDALAAIGRSDRLPDPSKDEGRPRFHFTSSRGWLNDPNGLVYFEGEYHLFYQHNPYGWEWGNMHWGHAVSADLMHWAGLPIALYPREYGDWAFSGSAVVDRSNSSGFGTAGAPPLVLAYTSTGRGECIASSVDRGRTWAEFSGNPVVRHAGRDPRLLRHEPTNRWIMAVYDETDGRRAIAFYSSTDLKSWAFESRIDGFYECPDLFELPVEDEPGRSLWVLSAADGEYLLGRFDGKAFRPEGLEKRRTWTGDFYAAQTYSDEPKGRRIQVGWARGVDFPGRPFNQQMTLPCELTLRKTPDGVRMFARPAAEFDALPDDGRYRWRSGDGGPSGGEIVLDPPGAPLDIRAEGELAESGRLELTMPGVGVVVDPAKGTVACNGTSAPLGRSSGPVRLRVVVDLGSVEVFVDDGRVAIARGLSRREPPGALTFRGAGAGTGFRSVEVKRVAIPPVSRGGTGRGDRE